MIQEIILRLVARFYSTYKDNRKTLKNVRTLVCFFRGLRIPIYKNIFDVIHFRSYFVVLDRLIGWRKPTTSFEWGPGLNTMLLAKHSTKVYSVENDKTWVDYYKDKVPANVEIIFSPIEDHDFLQYPTEIFKAREEINIVFIDGRCHVQCIQAAKEKSVPLVVMFNSLDYVTLEPTKVGPPPLSNANMYCKDGYVSYTYFVEVVDLRTIILFDDENEFEQIKNLFADLYCVSGKTVDYDAVPKVV